MILFWAVLAALASLSLVFIVWPLWRYRSQANAASTSLDDRLMENVRLFREHVAELEAQLADGRVDEVQFQQLKLEQERALLADEAGLRRAHSVVGKVATRPWVFVLLAILLLVLSAGLYNHLGSRADVEIQALHMAKQQPGQGADPARTRELIAALEARVAREPGQVQYWFILARNYMELNEFANASRAYLQVVERDAQSPMILAEAAQALFLRDGSQVSAQTESLAQAALALDQNNTTALGLLGVAAFSREVYQDAIKYWQQAVRVLGNTDAAASMAMGVERARQRYIEQGGNPETLQQLLAGRSIALQVEVADGLNLSPDLWVYVYARAWQGAKMPLAITRFKLSELPRQVVLSEAMAMAPSLTLASVEQVELVARVSQDGTAIAKLGDWQASLGPVSAQQPPTDLALRIEQPLTALD